jgi:hypothetical protein
MGLGEEEMAQLTEAYIRLQPFYITAERLEALGKATDTFARDAALRIYEQPVEIEVELIEGTLWGKIKVTGAIIFTVYTGYSSIDGAITTTERLCKNANIFGDYVCSSFIKESGASPHQVVRVEHRLKTPGKLRRALLRIERLDKAAKKLSKEELQKRLHDARRELNAAMKDLDVDEVKMLESTLQSLEHLPPVREWPDENTQKVEVPDIKKKVQTRLPLQQDLLIGNETVPAPGARRKLEYHSKFEVSPRSKSEGSASEEEEVVGPKKPIGGLLLGGTEEDP